MVKTRRYCGSNEELPVTMSGERSNTSFQMQTYYTLSLICTVRHDQYCTIAMSISLITWLIRQARSVHLPLGDLPGPKVSESLVVLVSAS